ncbi:MAG: hydrogenase [Elusimicrobia bacterium CG11_big_fil_rev_8_21_14_0_20_64_6]|nr:MAG: hydrogenase [Elusimicrobia bacterium CG11_big_fil_rev_8_21_14_0_20_64_6]
MWKIVKTRFQQGYRTSDYPNGPSGLPERFRGRPAVSGAPCAAGCTACAESCPTQAIRIDEAGKVHLDMGKCLFCTECVTACPEGVIAYTTDHRLAARTREDLVLSGPEVRLAQALEEKTRRLFGRSLKLREVCAGSCNGCEAELTALGNVIFDLSRFGVQFVASPRHADGLVITGPVTKNMRAALLATYAAMPAPKIVIAVGACAISGGPFAGSPQAHDGAASTVPVDLYIPGCPPHPLTVLDGILRLLGRLEDGSRKRD